jgi:hypothetical protein
MRKGEDYLDCNDKSTLGENRSTAETHFLEALNILNDNHADPAGFVKVYNGLMHVHLDLTFQSGLSIEEREEHLRTAMNYISKCHEIAQNSPGGTGALAQVKLQEAVLYGRSVLLRAKRGKGARGTYLLERRDEAVERIEQALGELRDSNHRTKEKSIAWGKDFQDRLKRL